MAKKQKQPVPEVMSPERLEKLEKLLRHVNSVRENCEVLGKRLIEHGEAELGLRLIANGFIHDSSKFGGIEWRHLCDDDDPALKFAIEQHNTTNPHHPEYWPGGVAAMPRLYIAEMLIDWKTRSNEFSTSLLDWIQGPAMKRFKYTKRNRVYREIMGLYNMLVEDTFN